MLFCSTVVEPDFFESAGGLKLMIVPSVIRRKPWNPVESKYSQSTVQLRLIVVANVPPAVGVASNDVTLCAEVISGSQSRSATIMASDNFIEFSVRNMRLR